MVVTGERSVNTEIQVIRGNSVVMLEVGTLNVNWTRAMLIRGFFIGIGADRGGQRSMISTKV